MGESVPGRTTATVGRIEHLGDQTRMHMTIDGTDLISLADPHIRLQSGEQILVGASSALFFDSAGERIRT